MRQFFKRGFHLIAFSFAAVLALSSALPAFAEDTIDGFHDLKFGMTKEEVEALDFCSTSTECLYELVGKNRYIYPQYRTGMSDTSNGSDTSPGRATETVSKIVIDFGRYTDHWYNDLRRMLGRTYPLTRDFDDATWNAFAAERIPEIVTAYAQGQVLLTITRRKFGNLIIKVIYQDKASAKENPAFHDAPPVTP